MAPRVGDPKALVALGQRWSSTLARRPRGRCGSVSMSQPTRSHRLPGGGPGLTRLRGAGFLLGVPTKPASWGPLLLHRRVPSTAGSYLGSTGPSATDGELEKVLRSVHVPIDDQAAAFAAEGALGQPWLSLSRSQSTSWNWGRTARPPATGRRARRSWSRAGAARSRRTGRPGFGPASGCGASRPRSGPRPPPSRIEQPARSWPCARHRDGSWRSGHGCAPAAARSSCGWRSRSFCGNGRARLGRGAPAQPSAAWDQGTGSPDPDGPPP